MLDDAAFFAANSVITDVFVLTVTFHVHLLPPVTKGVLTAHGRLVHQSKQFFLADADLLDDQERLVGRGNGTFMRSRVPLGPDVDYE